VPISQVIEMHLRKSQLARDCSILDDVESGHHNSPCQYVILNPLDESRAGQESVDEEKLKDIVWPKMVMAKLEVKQESPNSSRQDEGRGEQSRNQN
jgi:hypothetical protein